MRLADVIIEYLDYLPEDKYTAEMVPIFKLCESSEDQDNVESIVREGGTTDARS